MVGRRTAFTPAHAWMACYILCNRDSPPCEGNVCNSGAGFEFFQGQNSHAAPPECDMPVETLPRVGIHCVSQSHADASLGGVMLQLQTGRVNTQLKPSRNDM